MTDTRLEQLTDFTFAFTDGPRFYVGFETLAGTGVGSGAGSSSSSVLRVAVGTAVGSGAGSATSIGGVILAKTADGSASGSSVSSGYKVVGRSATGSGSGTTGDTVTTEKPSIFRPPVDDSFAWAYRGSSIAGYGLLSRLAKGQRVRNVYKLNDGSFTTNQPDEGDYQAVYLGSHNNFVSADEKADLVAAGYGDYVT